MTNEEFVAALDRAKKAERERCARVADTYVRSDKTEAETALCIAAAIRAQKDKPQE